MSKKTLSKEDSTLFRQSIGIVKKIESNNLLLTKRKKPKPYPKKDDSKDIVKFKELKFPNYLCPNVLRETN